MFSTRALSIGAAFVLVALAAPAHAEETDTHSLPARFGLVPLIGTGVAKVTNASPFPGFIGLSTLGGELHVELPPYGGFVRFQYHSSGLDGRWTAPSFALGGTYRVFGDGVNELALLARGGVLWERWHATNGDCPIDLFFPSNCKALTPTDPSGVVSGAAPVLSLTEDTLGVFAGARLELPVRSFFLALDGEASGVADVSGSVPGGVIALRVALAIGLRDVRATEEPRGPRGPSGPRQEKKF